MSNFSRRDILKASVIGPAAVAAVHGMGPLASAIDVHSETGESLFEPLIQTANDEAMKKAGRERLLLDFGWRFHLGHADDPAQDFGFGRRSEFAKFGELFRPSRPDFDDTNWRAIDLPHDWAVELPFVDDANVNQVGAKPLGRAYPATSIGWY